MFHFGLPYAMSYEPLMCKQLPGYVYQLLRSIGRTGDRIDCPVFAVGGFVRDLLIGRPNLDVDIVAEGDGIAFAHAFAESQAGMPVPPKIKCHQQFGTAVVTLPDGFKVDVATARTEVYDRPGALPSVKRNSIREDLRRRDFTINAMAIELNEGRFGELVDFFGGRSDLHSRSIRILHDKSFLDDPTRIFRAIRFEQRYGFSIEPHTEKLLGRAVAEDSLKRISGKRLRSEIFLILKEENLVPAIRRMAHFDLVKHMHPRICISDELVELFDRVKGVLAWWNSTQSSVHSKAEPVLLNLMALLDQLDMAEIEEASERLVLRKKHTAALKASKMYLPSIFKRMGETKNPPSKVYEMLKGLPLEVLLFAMAKVHGQQRSVSLRNSISSYLTQLRKVKPLVDGNDLRKLGYPEGPLYTQILERTFAAQLDKLIVDKHQAIQFVKDKFPL